LIIVTAGNVFNRDLFSLAFMAEQRTFDEAILENFRRQLFPEIGNGVISGYNVYLERPARTKKYLIEYLHSDLGKDENGYEYKHGIQLIEKIGDYCSPSIQEVFVRRIVDRISIYRRGRWDSDPPGTRFFDKHGNQIEIGRPTNYSGPIILEGKQHQLSVDVDELGNLNIILNLINQYANKFVLDSEELHAGQMNSLAINNAWDTPLVIVSSDDTLLRPDFVEVLDIVVRENDHIMSSLVNQTARRLEEILENYGRIFYNTNKQIDCLLMITWIH
jgi:hypothetical protein